MQYKTIALELLQERTQLHDRLRLTRRLLPVLNLCSRELRAAHAFWMQELILGRPQSHPNQIAGEAMELAIAELRDRLPAAPPQDDTDPFLLEPAMAYVRRHMPRG